MMQLNFSTQTINQNIDMLSTYEVVMATDLFNRLGATLATHWNCQIYSKYNTLSF